MIEALAAAVGGAVGSGAVTFLLSRRTPARAALPANPAVAALEAALNGRPDPRAPRDADQEPEERRERRPRLPLGI